MNVWKTKKQNIKNNRQKNILVLCVFAGVI